jgi:hypothetical protein
VEGRDGRVELFALLRMFVLIIASGIIIVNERDIWWF